MFLGSLQGPISGRLDAAATLTRTTSDTRSCMRPAITRTSLVPLDLQGSFFGIFSMIETVGQAVGPIIIGILARLTGSLRSGFAFMLGEAFVCIALLLLLKPAAGAAAATRLNRMQRLRGTSMLFGAHQKGCPYCKRIHRELSLEQCAMIEAQVSRESNVECERTRENMVTGGAAACVYECA